MTQVVEPLLSKLKTPSIQKKKRKQTYRYFLFDVNLRHFNFYCYRNQLSYILTYLDN
jgi:hypothetical protein